MKFNLLASASTLAMGGLVALALPGSAQAGLTCTVLTQSCTETIDLGSHQTSFIGTNALSVTLDLFAPGSGQNLTSVVITEGSTIASSGTLKNNGVNAATATFKGGLTLTTKAGAGAPSGFPTLSQLTQTTNLTQQNYTLAGGASLGYAYSGSLVNTSFTVASSLLSGFIGAGTFSAKVFGAASNLLGTSSGNLTASIVTLADPFVTITYDYTTPAPEPASMAILGAGLAGLGVLRRRRKA